LLCEPRRQVASTLGESRRQVGFRHAMIVLSNYVAIPSEGNLNRGVVPVRPFTFSLTVVLALDDS